MSVPHFSFPIWLEAPYHYDSNLTSTLEETKRMHGLGDRLQTAHVPISGLYEECPELRVWGFSATQPCISSTAGMDILVARLETLGSALSNPDQWVEWAMWRSANKTQLTNFLGVGEHLCRHYDGCIDIAVRSHSGQCHGMRLATDPLRLASALDQLQAPRLREMLKEPATILFVDLERGLVHTSIGVMQFSDPNIASRAISYIGRRVTMDLDLDASALRVKIPEICGLTLETEDEKDVA